MSHIAYCKISDEENQQNSIGPETDGVECDLETYKNNSGDGYEGDDECDAPDAHETEDDSRSDDKGAYSGVEGSSGLGEAIDEWYEGDIGADTPAADEEAYGSGEGSSGLGEVIDEGYEGDNEGDMPSADEEDP